VSTCTTAFPDLTDLTSVSRAPLPTTSSSPARRFAFVTILSMTSTPSSPHPSSTPVHSHPLSPDEVVPTRGRRSRGRGPAHDDGAPSYFAPKHQVQLESPASTRSGSGSAAARPSNWDGSIRGIGRMERQTSSSSLPLAASSASLAVPRETHRRQHPAPLFVVGAPPEDESTPPRTPLHRTRSTGILGLDAPVDSRTAQILNTRWHDYSDEAIQGSIARLGTTDSPADARTHPYHDALRTLSLAVHALSKARTELEESRRKLEDKEKAMRGRSEGLLRELKPSEREVARKVLQSLFTDDDEEAHRVERRQSHAVSTRRIYLRSGRAYSPTSP
jgi:hypothetical protein